MNNLTSSLRANSAFVPFETLANLFPRQLDVLSQDTLMGYQIIDAYQQTVMQQFQLLENYLNGPILMDERLRFHDLGWEFLYNKQCAQRWPEIKAYMERVYELVIQPLILNYEAASDRFSQLVQSFEEPGAKAELLDSLRKLKDNTREVVKELAGVKKVTINFREHLEQTVRKNQEFLDKQLAASTQKTKAELHLQSLASTQAAIATFNRSFLSKTYALQINHSFTIDGVVISCGLKNALTMATTGEEYLSLPKSLLEEGHELIRCYQRVQGEASQLAALKREMSYFALFSHEFSKFQKSLLNAISANVNLGDTWESVGSNLEILIDRVEKVKSLTNEDKNTIIRLHLVVLKKSITKLKEEMEQFKKNKLLPIKLTASLQSS